MSGFIEDAKQLWAHYSTFFIVGFMMIVLGALAFFSPYFLARMSGEDWRTAEQTEDPADSAGLPPLAANRSVVSARTEIRSLADLMFMHHDAMGGRQAIERIQSVRMVGTVISDNEDSHQDFVIIKRRPRMVRMNLTNQNVRVTYVFNDVQGRYRVTTAQGSRVMDMNAEQLRNFEFDSEIFNPISDPGRSLTNLRFHGLVQYRGQELYKVEFARTDLVTDFYFFNPESFLVSYLQRTRGDTEVPRTELFQYLEYRLLDGIPVAYLVNQILVGEEGGDDDVLKVRFSQIEWNPGLFSHAFSLNLD